MSNLLSHLGARILLLAFSFLLITCNGDKPTYDSKVDTVINKLYLDTLVNEDLRRRKFDSIRFSRPNERRVPIPRRQQARNLTVCIKLGDKPSWNIYNSINVYLVRDGENILVANFTKKTPNYIMITIPDENGGIDYRFSTEFVKHTGRVIDRGRWIEEGQPGYDINGRCLSSEGPIVSVTSASSGSTRVTVSIDE